MNGEHLKDILGKSVGQGGEWREERNKRAAEREIVMRSPARRRAAEREVWRILFGTGKWMTRDEIKTHKGGYFAVEIDRAIRRMETRGAIQVKTECRGWFCWKTFRIILPKRTI